VLAQPEVTTALVGARTPVQVAENVAAASVKLSAEEVARIGQAFDGITS
jgi:aryl-alcohol dehydrogenase-like predicted oxidoreductase